MDLLGCKVTKWTLVVIGGCTGELFPLFGFLLGASLLSLAASAAVELFTRATVVAS